MVPNLLASESTSLFFTAVQHKYTIKGGNALSDMGHTLVADIMATVWVASFSKFQHSG